MVQYSYSVEKFCIFFATIQAWCHKFYCKWWQPKPKVQVDSDSQDVLRVKMLNRWCYTVDIVRFLLPQHAFSVRCLSYEVHDKRDVITTLIFCVFDLLGTERPTF